jgi:phenylacetic acid degradation operon negative regulatory protein
MKAKTEELLYHLLWNAEKLARPTLRNVYESFEGWAYRSGLMRQLAELERRKFLESHTSGSNQRLYRLTEQGRLHALGGNDPEARWSRPWDGRWRFVLFDIPVDHGVQRNRLRSYLRDRSFGCLQQSVWISPDPITHEEHLLRDTQTNVQSLIFLEGRPCAGETDSSIVSTAWDFDAINAAYSRHLEVLDKFPVQPVSDKTTARALQQWGTEERLAWAEATALDPFLPEQLLPANYLGHKAWTRRIKTLHEAGKQIRSFTP